MSLHSATLTINPDLGCRNLTFNITPRTEISINGRPARLLDLSVGMTVWVKVLPRIFDCRGGAGARALKLKEVSADIAGASEMDCPGFARVIDYLDGQLKRELAVEVAAHIAAGCSRCEADYEWYEHVKTVAAADDTVEPPPWV